MKNNFVGLTDYSSASDCCYSAMPINSNCIRQRNSDGNKRAQVSSTHTATTTIARVRLHRPALYADASRRMKTDLNWKSRQSWTSINHRCYLLAAMILLFVSENHVPFKLGSSKMKHWGTVSRTVFIIFLIHCLSWRGKGPLEAPSLFNWPMSLENEESLIFNRRQGPWINHAARNFHRQTINGTEENN